MDALIVCDSRKTISDLYRVYVDTAEGSRMARGAEAGTGGRVDQDME